MQGQEITYQPKKIFKMYARSRWSIGMLIDKEM